MPLQMAFVEHEALQGFQPTCEVVGGDLVSEMLAELVMGLVMIPIDGRLDGSVHPLDLTVGPRVVGSLLRHPSTRA
jgi:hypothetical protein